MDHLFYYNKKIKDNDKINYGFISSDLEREKYTNNSKNLYKLRIKTSHKIENKLNFTFYKKKNKLNTNLLKNNLNKKAKKPTKNYFKLAKDKNKKHNTELSDSKFENHSINKLKKTFYNNSLSNRKNSHSFNFKNTVKIYKIPYKNIKNNNSSYCDFYKKSYKVSERKININNYYKDQLKLPENKIKKSVLASKKSYIYYKNAELDFIQPETSRKWSNITSRRKTSIFRIIEKIHTFKKRKLDHDNYFYMKRNFLKNKNNRLNKSNLNLKFLESPIFKSVDLKKKIVFDFDYFLLPNTWICKIDKFLNIKNLYKSSKFKFYYRNSFNFNKNTNNSNLFEWENYIKLIGKDLKKQKQLIKLLDIKNYN